MKTKKKKVEISSKLIEEDYMEHSPEEDDEMFWIKEALKAMSPLERKIYVTYLETGTYTGTAEAFKVSVPTLQAYVKKLTARIAEFVCDRIK